MTNCPSCSLAFEPTSTPPRCPACGAVAPVAGGFAPTPMGAVPGQGAYAPGPAGPYGPPQGYGSPAGPPRDLDIGWLLWGGIAMVFCCQPMGIAALVLMDQAKTAYRQGDDARAQAKLGSMRTCIYIGIGLAVAVALIYVVLIVAGVSAAILSSPSHKP